MWNCLPSVSKPLPLRSSAFSHVCSRAQLAFYNSSHLNLMIHRFLQSQELDNWCNCQWRQWKFCMLHQLDRAEMRLHKKLANYISPSRPVNRCGRTLMGKHCVQECVASTTTRHCIVLPIRMLTMLSVMAIDCNSPILQQRVHPYKKQHIWLGPFQLIKAWCKTPMKNAVFKTAAAIED